MRNYYCLVAGLVDYAQDSAPKGFDAATLRNTIAEELDAPDREALELFYAFYDIQNVIAYLAGKDVFNPLGIFTAQEIAYGVDRAGVDLDEELEQEARPLPAFITNTINAHQRHTEEGVPLVDLNCEDDNEEEEEGLFVCSSNLEASLWTAYYRECEKSPCTFVRQWSHFEMTLRNVCTAFTARAKKLPIAEELVGRGEVVTALSQSSAADFGLRNEIDYLDPIIAMLETKSLLDKERSFARIRWKMAEELSEFNYFDLNKILSYLAKVNIIHRWLSLDRKQGEAMLQRLLGELTDKNLITRSESKPLNQP